MNSPHSRSITALVVLLLLVVLAQWTPLRAAEPPTNIVFILADDLGYGEVGVYGQEKISTPRLDQMAAEGLRFRQFYAGSAVCAPSRSVLMTGQHLGHTRVRGNAGLENPRAQMLRAADITVAEVLQKAGYRTALIGKWGLGEADTEGHPNQQGFDYFFGYLNQKHAHNYYPEFLIRNSERVLLKNELQRQGAPYEAVGAGLAAKKAEYAPDLLLDDALRWIGEQREQPFFLYFSTTLPHANNEATRLSGDGNEVPDFGSYADKPWPAPARHHAAMMERMDRDVGRLIDRLKELGLSEKTLVIFSSDNGHHKEGGHDPDFFDPNGPLRGMKRDLYEGGIRVPTIAHWPGKIAPGRVSDHVGYFGDFMATAAELAGAPTPERVDSISFLPELLGKTAEQRRHEGLYWEFHEKGFQQAALLEGRWKGVRNGGPGSPLEVYDLSQDLREKNDIAAKEPALVQRLEQYLAAQHVDSEDWPIRAARPGGGPASE